LCYWQKVAGCLLLVVGKKAFTLFLELRSFSSFRVAAIRLIRWPFTSNQQQATAFPACPGWENIE